MSSETLVVEEAAREKQVWTLRARWVFPIDQPPVPYGVVTICGEQIVEVGPAKRRSVDRDLGEVALLPGLVNAHTHLDLSDLRGRDLPRQDFLAWLRAVVAHRRQQTPAQVQAAIRAGLAECLRTGTTLIGDIAAGGQSWEVLAEAPCRAVVFYELLGLTPERAAQALAAARTWAAAHPAQATCRPGLSPHAPYSVRRELFRQAADGRPPLPLAIHLAETRAEEELLARREGPFVSFLSELGVWDPTGLVSSWQEVLELAPPAPCLFIHGNYLGEEESLPAGAALVVCPRTCAAFGHPRHPFPSWLRRGVPVALGTDSLASNPDLDLLAEARFLRRCYPEVPPATLLHLATLAGAQALGWGEVVGSLTPGKSADLVVVPLPSHQEPADPADLVLDSDLPVAGVLYRGRWLVPLADRPEARNQLTSGLSPASEPSLP